MRELSAQEVLQRLEDRFGLLNSGPRTCVPRQRTLRAAIDWSYDMCSQGERLLWSRLSVFAGSVGMEAAEQVCCGEGIEPGQVLDLITGLVDKSVLLCEEHGSRTRYRLLETLRAYGLGKLSDGGEEETLRRRHRDWYQDLTQRADQDWNGPAREYWLAQLGEEQANLRAALEYSLTTPGQARAVLAKAGALWWFWHSAGAFREARSWIERALDLDTEDSPQRAKALWILGWFCAQRGDLAVAVQRLAEARQTAQRMDDSSALAWTAQWTAVATMCQGDLPGAVTLAAEALGRQRDLDDRGGTMIALVILTLATSTLADPQSAAYGEEAVALCEKAGNRAARQYALWALGREMLRQGDTARATTLLRDGIRLGTASGNKLASAFCIATLAWVAEADGRYEHAAKLLGAVRPMWTVLEVTPHLLPPDAAAHQRCVTQARQALGDKAFEQAVSAGANLSFEDACALAASEQTAPAARQAAAGTTDALSRREREVAALVAKGMSNKDIAAHLVISTRTAEGHVERILAKLGFRSRAQIAAWTTHRPD